MEIMRQVTLHGELASLFGEEWSFAASRTRSVAEVVRALSANLGSDFQNHMMLAHTRGIAYRVVVGGHDVSEDSCRRLEPVGSRDIEIVPVPIGEGGSAGGAIQAVLGVLLIIIGAGLTPFTAGTSAELIVIGIGLLVGGIVSLILAPPEIKDREQALGTGFSGGSTVLQEGEAIPVLFGEGLVTGQAISVEIQAGSDGEKTQHQTMRILDVLSEGEIEGIVGIGAPPVDVEDPPDWYTDSYFDLFYTFSYNTVLRGAGSVYLNDVPATESRDVKVLQSVGASDQAPLPGFSESRNIINVGIEMESTVSYPEAIAAPDGTKTLRFNFFITNLVRQSKKGSQEHTTMDWTISVTDAVGRVVERHIQITDVILSRRNFSYELDVSNLTPGLTAKAVKNSADSSSRHRYDLWWSSIVAIGDVQFSYPHTALCGIEFKSDDFQSIPDRKYFARGLLVQIPSNYDPVLRTYSGVWDGTFKQERAYTNNPAWCLYELLTNKRFGMGRWITETDIDIWALYRAGIYADTTVDTNDTTPRIDWDVLEYTNAATQTYGTFANHVFQYHEEANYKFPATEEPMSVLNAHIRSRSEAWDLIRDLCSSMFAMPLWTGNAVSVMQDRDEDPVYEYNRDNVIGGNFRYSRTPLRERTNRVVASYNDENDLGRERKVVQEFRPEVARYGVREKQVVAVGATQRSQAVRFARWILLTENLGAEGVSFQTGPETGGAPVAPGSIVLVHDPHKGAGKVFGRTSAPDTENLDVLRLDREVEIEAGGTYSVDIIMPSVHEDLVADRNETSIALQGLLPNDDYRLARVWVDTTGDGNPDTRREPNSWSPVGKLLGIVDEGFDSASVAYRIEYPQALHTSDVSDAPGTYTQLTLATPALEPIPETSVFIVTKPNATKRKWRVIALKEIERGKFEISAIKHDPAKYPQISDGISLEPPVIDPPSEGIGIRPPAPVGLEISIQARLSPDNTLLQDIVVIWREPDSETPGSSQVTGYEVTWERFGNAAVTQVISRNQFVVENAQLGEYHFTVRSRRYDGRVSAPVERSYSFTSDALPTFTARTSGLELEGQGNDTEFTTRDIILVWRLNTELFGAIGFSSDEESATDDGFGDPLLAHWEVIVRDGETLTELRRDIVPKGEAQYVYSFDRNLADGGPRRDLEFEVTPKDSLPIARSGFGSSIRVTNPNAPVIDSAYLTLVSEYNWQLMRVSGAYPKAVDHKGYLFLVSQTQDFDPLDASASEAFFASGDEGIYQVDPDTEYFWRVAAVDSFVDEPLLPSRWDGLNFSIQFSSTSGAAPLTGPIEYTDIEVGTISHHEHHEIMSKLTDFFDGTSGTQGSWELVSEQSLASRGGLVDVVQIFNVETVYTQGLEIYRTSWVGPSDYMLVGVASTPRVKYRITRRLDGTPPGDPSEIPLIEGGPMNISAVGYFVGGFLSIKDTPPVNTLLYRTEMMWLDDIYDDGQMSRTGVLDVDWHEFEAIGARWATFMFQGAIATGGDIQHSDWVGRVKWKNGPGDEDYTGWYDCKVGQIGPWIYGSPDNIRMLLEPAAFADPDFPGVGVGTDYRIDLAEHQGGSSLIMDITSGDMVVTEWSR